MTSGFSGSPAPITSFSFTGHLARSSRISTRHTVGGAHSEVTPQRTSVSSVNLASKRAWLSTKMVAPAFHGA